MCKRLLVISIVIASSTTMAFGYVSHFGVGTGNGAFYFLGGPPQNNYNSQSVGSFQNGAQVNQQAAASTPWGVGVAGQGAGARGSQIGFYGLQAQSLEAGMGQSAFKLGGSGYVEGVQTGSATLTQGSHSTLQGAHATGMQMSGIYGGLSGHSSQAMCVSTGQIQIR